MTQTQLYMAIGIPILFNTIGFLAMFLMIGSLDRRISVIEHDLKEFYKSLHDQDKRISHLEKK